MSKENKIEPELHVLIVDDERDDLAILCDSFRALSEGRWHIDAADSMVEALQIAKKDKIQLFVLAMNTPVLDVALLFSSFGSQSSKFKKVVMASHATDEIRAASLAAGADLFIEKPLSPEGLKAAFADISKLAGWVLPQNFQSGSRSVGMADLIQMECLARNSSILELFHEHSLGRIYIEEGQIIHAVCGEISGERAFQKLFTLTGTYELHDFELPPERTLNRTWEFLLGEAARYRDSLNARAQAGKTFAASTGAVSGEPSGRTVEMLVASDTGEIFYHWQCTDAAGRLTLLQEIARRAEKIIPEIQLGKLDRLEIQLPVGRAVLQPRADRLIFVRLEDNPVK